MNSFPKQLINVVGALVVLAVLAAGVLLVALPMFTQSNTTATEARSAANSNEVYAAQVSALRVQERDFAAVQQDVTALREEITAVPDFDDVFEIVADAADASGGTVQSITAEDPTAWTMRTAPEGDDDDAAAPAAETATAEAPTEDGTDAAPDADAVPAAPSEDSPQRQASFVIVVEFSEGNAALTFLDGLAAGPRLLSVVHSEFVKDAEKFRVTVNALAFIRAED